RAGALRPLRQAALREPGAQRRGAAPGRAVRRGRDRRGGGALPHHLRARVHVLARRTGRVRRRASRGGRRGGQAHAGAAAADRPHPGRREEGPAHRRLRDRGRPRGGRLRRRAARARRRLRRPRDRRDEEQHGRCPSEQPGDRRRVRQPRDHPRRREGGQVSAARTETADPITLEIIQSSLQAISDEMFLAFRKTAMSAIIYEVLDMGTGITDAEGNLASSGAGIPGFVGVLDKAVQRVIELNGDVAPGDVFATNDPFYGGVTHLNDVVLAMPVFADGELVAWTANIAHWNDVGGIVPGSISNESTEIYQEGLRLPAIKLIDRGGPIRSVLEIMKCNSRLPDYLEGDMWAGIAAARVGERHIPELIEKYGRETFLAALGAFMDAGEEAARRAIAELPKGTFSLEEEQDSGAVYRVAVHITDDELVVDLRDNPDQDRGPNNASRDGAVVAAQMVFMNITNADSTANAGHFAPLKVLTRPGSVFDAAPPAAFATYYEVEIRLYDLIWRCLAPHLGDRLPAGSFASICG